MEKAPKLRKMGQVGQGHLDDPFALAPRFPQQDGRRGVTVGDNIGLHGLIISMITINCQNLITITWVQK